MALAQLLIIFFLLFTTTTLSTTTLSQNEDQTHFLKLMERACVNVNDRSACISNLQSECQKKGNRASISLLNAAVKATMDEVRRAIDLVTKISALSTDRREQIAIDDCRELLEYSMDELGMSMSEMEKIRSGTTHDSTPHKGNLNAWLSAALSNQDTCLEGFEGTNGHVKRSIQGSLKQVTQLVSNVLAMFKSIHSVPAKPPRNSTTTARTRSSGTEYPKWVSAEERELVQASPESIHVDAVVALDGSGRYRSITEAIYNAPSHSTKRYVIYVKQGVYKENVELKKKKSYIVLVGDGIGKTIITGSRNFLQGWTTFRTATFAVSGMGFIARDITFRNTAGPMSRQAVALRVDSDRSAFFRCSVEGYQDTLYAHSLRQFYRECSVYGTIDFIFGNGAAVLQNCKIFTRDPLPYQKTTITAQGRKDPNQGTGFSIQNSYVYASHPTYLGRPWKPYSRTVFMQTYLNEQVMPQGWLEWYGNFALDTLYYGEYLNYGPGAGVQGRVRWPGYHVMKDASQASFFTVARFIDGQSWLPATGVSFTAGLTK